MSNINNSNEKVEEVKEEKEEDKSWQATFHKRIAESQENSEKINLAYKQTVGKIVNIIAPDNKILEASLDLAFNIALFPANPVVGALSLFSSTMNLVGAFVEEPAKPDAYMQELDKLNQKMDIVIDTQKSILHTQNIILEKLNKVLNNQKREKLINTLNKQFESLNSFFGLKLDISDNGQINFNSENDFIYINLLEAKKAIAEYIKEEHFKIREEYNSKNDMVIYQEKMKKLFTGEKLKKFQNEFNDIYEDFETKYFNNNQGFYTLFNQFKKEFELSDGNKVSVNNTILNMILFNQSNSNKNSILYPMGFNNFILEVSELYSEFIQLYFQAMSNMMGFYHDYKDFKKREELGYENILKSKSQKEYMNYLLTELKSEIMYPSNESIFSKYGYYETMSKFSKLYYDGIQRLLIAQPQQFYYPKQGIEATKSGDMILHNANIYASQLLCVRNGLFIVIYPDYEDSIENFKVINDKEIIFEIKIYNKNNNLIETKEIKTKFGDNNFYAGYNPYSKDVLKISPFPRIGGNVSDYNTIYEAGTYTPEVNENAYDMTQTSATSIFMNKLDIEEKIKNNHGEVINHNRYLTNYSGKAGEEIEVKNSPNIAITLLNLDSILIPKLVEEQKNDIGKIEIIRKRSSELTKFSKAFEYDQFLKTINGNEIDYGNNSNKINISTFIYSDEKPYGVFVKSGAKYLHIYVNMRGSFSYPDLRVFRTDHNNFFEININDTHKLKFFKQDNGIREIKYFPGNFVLLSKNHSFSQDIVSKNGKNNIINWKGYEHDGNKFEWDDNRWHNYVDFEQFKDKKNYLMNNQFCFAFRLNKKLLNDRENLSVQNHSDFWVSRGSGQFDASDLHHLSYSFNPIVAFNENKLEKQFFKSFSNISPKSFNVNYTSEIFTALAHIEKVHKHNKIEELRGFDSKKIGTFHEAINYCNSFGSLLPSEFEAGFEKLSDTEFISKNGYFEKVFKISKKELDKGFDYWSYAPYNSDFNLFINDKDGKAFEPENIIYKLLKVKIYNDGYKVSCIKTFKFSEIYDRKELTEIKARILCQIN